MTSLNLSKLVKITVALLLVPVLHSVAYTPFPWKWDSRQVPYYVNAANLDVAPSAAVAAIQAGASAWTAQSNAGFGFYYAGATNGNTIANNSKNEVFFRDGSSGSAIASTYHWSSGSKVLDTDIIFWDGAYTFYTGSSGCSRGFYIEDIATHEFGHALGLAHSSVSEATMVLGVGYCSTNKRSLARDDVDGVESLYPPFGSNQTPKVTISSPIQGSSLTAGSPVTFSGAAQDSEDGNLSSRISWASNVDGPLGSGATIQKALSSGSHTIRATVSDSAGATSYSQVGVSVAAATSNPSGVTLSGSGRKVKGVKYVDLRWSGASWTGVDVYRDGAKVGSTANSGAYTDGLNSKGGGSYGYRICAAGTSTCSGQIIVAF